MDTASRNTANSNESSASKYSPDGQAVAGRPRKEEECVRLHKLLRTAETLFLDRGYDGVSLESIAHEAHVAVRTIYVKFGGKIGLLHEVISNTGMRYFDDLMEVSIDRGSMVEILTDFSNRIVMLMSDPSFLRFCRMVLAEAPKTPSLSAAFYRAGPQQLREKLHRFFSRPDITDQLHSHLTAESITTHLLNCLLGDLIWTTWFGQKHAANPMMSSQVDERLQLFFSSVSKRQFAQILN